MTPNTLPIAWLDPYDGRMIDRLDPLRRSRLMQKVRTNGTGPERDVRSILHRLGYRFRLHVTEFGLPARPPRSVDTGLFVLLDLTLAERASNF